MIGGRTVAGSMYAGTVTHLLLMGDSSVFVLSRTGHFGYSSIHNSVNIIGRTFMLHLHGSCHICVSMCDQHFL